MNLKNIQWKKLLICVAIPLAVGGAAALLTRSGIERYAELTKPPLSPPAWLFPIVWTVLYVLMGIASYLVLTSQAPKEAINRALKVYLAQLFLNFVWPLLFFNLSAYLFAFVWLVLLWLMIVGMLILFDRISKPASYLITPYLLWVTFAAYLNLSVYALN